MRRAIQTLGLAVCCSFIFTAPASSSDHLLKINEIFVGTPGGAQFVELFDSSVEPFLNGPYKLVVYDGSGTAVGRTTLPSAELAATGGTPYLVANAAQGGTPDEMLTATLPARGQICYTRGVTETKIHCVAYGCPLLSPFTSESGSDVSGAIGPAQSAQRQANGSYGVGPPTPDAANAALVPVPCPGGGSGGGGGGGGTGADKTKPVLKLGGKRRQQLSKLAVLVRVNETSSVLARGSVKLGKRKLALKKVRRTVHPGKKVKLRLRLSHSGKTAALAALDSGRNLRASVRVTATDASKNASRKTRTIRVVP
jgi:hypothetical protein